MLARFLGVQNLSTLEEMEEGFLTVGNERKIAHLKNNSALRTCGNDRILAHLRKERNDCTYEGK
jgi:hypothetical protein